MSIMLGSSRNQGFQLPNCTDDQPKLDIEMLKEQAETRMKQLKFKPRHFRILRFNFVQKLAMAIAECYSLDVRIELGRVSGYITFTGSEIACIGTSKRNKYLHLLVWLIKCADSVRIRCSEVEGLPMLQIVLTHNLHKVCVQNKRDRELEQLLT